VIRRVIDKEEDMSDARSRAQREMEQEADSFTGGPGIVASKSQARGAGGGILLGTVVGGVIGLLLGALLFEGVLGVIVAGVAFAAAGATFGGVTGGFVGPRKNLEGSEADR
jgi:hypothetical protein